MSASAASLLLLAATLGSAGERPPWVAFESPPFTGEGRPHGGPDWAFATPRLPALSAAGDEVLVAKTEIVPGGVPNLTLVVLRVADGAAVSSHVLLAAAEFSKAGAAAPGGDPSAVAGAFAALAELVRRRIAEANREFASKTFRPMTACRIADPADDVQPACSMTRQRIDCAGVAIRYEGGALRGTWRRRAFRVGGAHDFKPASVPDPSNGTVPVRACLGGVWLDAEHGGLVGIVRNECQRGGDWCIVQPKWLVARLPGPVTPSR